MTESLFTLELFVNCISEPHSETVPIISVRKLG